MGKVFSHPERQRLFEQTVEGLRKLFPNAKESFIRGQAQSKARNLPVKKVATPPSAPISVAQTYRAPTRADRAESHRNKMLWKAQRRAGQAVATKEQRATPSYRGRLAWAVAANLSDRHPDAGMSHAEHARRKAGRG